MKIAPFSTVHDTTQRQTKNTQKQQQQHQPPFQPDCLHACIVGIDWFDWLIFIKEANNIYEKQKKSKGKSAICIFHYRIQIQIK